MNDTVSEEKRDEILGRKDLLLSEDVLIHTLSSQRFDWDSWEVPEGATWDLLAVEVLASALNGFVDYFKGQWETVKGAVTDPWGHIEKNLKQYLEKPWMLIGPGALYETVLKPMVLQAIGQWQDLFEGDISGLSYRAGEATAAGVELLVLNKLGEVVGKYVVKPDGRINKVAGEGKTQAGAGKALINNMDDIFENPKVLGNATPKEWYQYFQENGYNPQPLGSKSSLRGIPFDQGGGFRIHWGGDRYLQYHPATSSHHGSAYWKISSGSTGALRFDLNGDLLP